MKYNNVSVSISHIVIIVIVIDVQEFDAVTAELHVLPLSIRSNNRIQYDPLIHR